MSSYNYSQSFNSSKAVSCSRYVYIIEDEYIAADYFFALLTISLNVLTCPPIILLNTLVIITVRTKLSLQTQHNILLACMAVTDLAVGILQPAYIAKDVLLMNVVSTISSSVYCTFNQAAHIATIGLSLISLFHLALIALERYVAMKYSLRYDSTVTEFRLTVAVALSWLIGSVYSVLRGINIVSVWLLFIFMLVSLLVTIFCHISVYSVSRRHMKQIKSEQVSAEAKRKFFEERKALKTTTIIIGGVFMSYLPSILGDIARRLPSSLANRLSLSSRPLTASCRLFNSLFNPIIYCWRNAAIRQAVKQLLKRQEN